MNIYRKYYDDPNDLQRIANQHMTTRLFFVIFTVVLNILSIYVSSTFEIRQETIYQPNENQVNQFRQMYPISLSCSCTEISVPYNAFVSLQPHYHQICSSIFVTESWITFITFYNVSVGPLAASDIRVSASSFFRMLQTLCRFAQQTIVDSEYIFLQTQLISVELLEKSLFELQVRADIHDWQAATINAFARDQQLIRNIIQGNQIMAGFLLNFYFSLELNNQLKPFSNPISMQNNGAITYSRCLCAVDQTCAWQSFITGDNISPRRFIPGMFGGCYPINSVLQSALECFYNQTCMNILQVGFGGSPNETRFPILNSSLNSKDETIENIVKRLMVDNWQVNVNYSAYFNACALTFCTYEYTQRHSFSYLITMIIGCHSTAPRKTMRQHFQAIRDRIYSFNLFRQVNSDDIKVQIQRQLTRFFANNSISSPSLVEYQHLYNRMNLQCSCSRVAIPYSSFLSLKLPTYHQIL
ncbi:hypothetical protein I4U23_016063 [Adineta vaga]|nr:hypothetical protein I4U23_016063 [Adineta vaga]